MCTSVCKHLPVHAHVCVHTVIAASVARFHVYVLIGNKRHFGGGKFNRDIQHKLIIYLIKTEENNI